MNIEDLLDRPIAFHRCFVDLVDSVAGAILLSQALYWNRRCQQEDGWWYKTAEEWESETGMRRSEFETARKACSKYLEFERKGLPCKTYYRVNSTALSQDLAALMDLQASLRETSKQACMKPANRLAGNQHSTNTETTAETTTKKGATLKPVLDDEDPNSDSLKSKKKAAAYEKARIVINLINQIANSRYQENDTNLSLVVSRMSEPGVTLEGVTKMLYRMWAAWKGKPDMIGYFRPSTLFGKQKFDGYYGAPDAIAEQQKPRQLNGWEKSDKRQRKAEIESEIRQLTDKISTNFVSCDKEIMAEKAREKEANRAKREALRKELAEINSMLA